MLSFCFCLWLTQSTQRRPFIVHMCVLACVCERVLGMLSALGVRCAYSYYLYTNGLMCAHHMCIKFVPCTETRFFVLCWFLLPMAPRALAIMWRVKTVPLWSRLSFYLAAVASLLHSTDSWIMVCDHYALCTCICSHLDQNGDVMQLIVVIIRTE